MISTPPDSVACLLQSLLLKYQAQVELNTNPVDIPKPGSSGPPADREVSPGISHVCSTRNEADRSAATAHQQARAPPVASAQQAAAFQLPRAKRTKPLNAEQLAGQYLAKRLKTIQQNKQKASQTQHKSASPVAPGAQSPADAPKRSSWAIGSSLQQPQHLESLREGPLGERQSTASAAGHQQQQAQNVHPEPGQQAPGSTATVADSSAGKECKQGSAHIAAAADGLELILQRQQQELGTDAGAAAADLDDDLLHLWNKGLQEDSSMHGAVTAAAAEESNPHPAAAASATVAGQAGTAGVVDGTAAAVLEASVAAGDAIDDVVMTGSSPQAAPAAAASPLNRQDTKDNAAAVTASGMESPAAASTIDADPNSTAARVEVSELMHGVQAAPAAQLLATQPRQSEPSMQQPQQQQRWQPQQGEQQQQHQQQAAQQQHAHQQQLPMDNEEPKAESAAAAPAAAKTSFVCQADSPQPTQAAAAVLGARRFTLASLLFAMPELPIKQVPKAPGNEKQPAAGKAKPKQSAAAAGPVPAQAAPPAGLGKATDLSANRPAGHYAGKRHTPPQQLQRQPPQPQVSAAGLAADKHPQAAAAVTSDSSSDEEGEIAEGDLSPPTIAAAAWDYANPSAGSDGDDHELMSVDDPAAAAAAGLKRKRKKSRGGRQVRQRQQRAEADRAAAAAGGAGGALGLYAEIKQWEKENSKGRKQKLGPVDAARELRFSITEKPPCRFWQMGRCSKGADCPYPHTGQPASKLIGCKFHQRGQCRHGDECRFSHEDISKQPCPDMVLYHKCSKQAGGDCAYSHEQLEPDVAEALRRMLLKMQDDEQQQQQQQMVQTGAQQVDKQQRPGLAPPAAPQQQQQQSVIPGPAPPQQSFDQWQQQQQDQKQQAATGLNQQTTWHQQQLGTHLQGQQAPMPPLQWQQMNLAPQHHSWPPQQQLQPQHPPGIHLQQSRQLLPTSLLQQRTLAVPSPAMPPQGVPPQNPVHLHQQQAHQQQHQQLPRPGVHGASGRVMRPG